MNSTASISFPASSPPPAYEAAMADLERRAWADQLTLAQAKREILALRNQFVPEPAAVVQWAILARHRSRAAA